MTDRGSEKRMHSKDIHETNPNPHGEQEANDLSIQSDHESSTAENVPQNPSMTENRTTPSVTGALEDPSTDSMFNNADPQTSELLKKKTSKDRSPAKPKGNRRRKTA